MHKTPAKNHVDNIWIQAVVQSSKKQKVVLVGDVLDRLGLGKSKNNVKHSTSKDVDTIVYGVKKK